MMLLAYNVATNDSWLAVFAVGLVVIGVALACAARWAWLFVSGLLRKPEQRQ